MSQYLLVRKSTLLLLGLAAAGVAGYCYYKRHRKALKAEAEQMAEDVTEMVNESISKAKEVADKAKS